MQSACISQQEIYSLCQIAIKSKFNDLYLWCKHTIRRFIKISPQKERKEKKTQKKAQLPQKNHKRQKKIPYANS